jgi:hypothetical protein
MTVTYFDNFRKVDDPKFFPVDMVLDRIKNGTSKELIEQLRSIQDPEQQKDFKLNKLPSQDSLPGEQPWPSRKPQV